MNNKDAREAVRDLMGMSQEQREYAAAKAMYQTIKERVDKEKSTIVPGDLTTPEGWEPYTAIEEKYGYWKAVDNLRDAEKKMIAWAQALLKQRSPEAYEKVKTVFETPIYAADLRQKLIDLCFRLNANT